MSAEEMRNDLETFVNQGLSQGWGGWPTKGLAPHRVRPVTLGAYSESAKPVFPCDCQRQGAVVGMGQVGEYGCFGLNVWLCKSL